MTKKSPKILILRLKPNSEPTSSNWSSHTSEGILLLREAGHEVIEIEPDDVSGWSQVLDDVDAVIFRPWMQPSIPPERLTQATKLKVVAGTFDLRYNAGLLSARGIAVIDTSRSMTPSVAEFAVLLALLIVRDAANAIQDFKKGRWERVNWPDRPGVYGDLSHRSIGLAGYGSINRRVGELLAGFSCKTFTFDPHVSDAVLANADITRASSLVALARESEIFFIGIPPLPDTKQIISREVIQAIPSGGILILVTRMAVVDQEALWERVKQGDLYVGIDVFDPEPPAAGTWFLHHPHVVASPHIAGGANFCHRRCFTTACVDAVKVLNEEQPLYQVNQRDIAIYQHPI